MTALAPSFAPSPVREPGITVGAELERWLVGEALPLWATAGVDREAGGFFEMLDAGGRPVAAPRRARVVARQIYVFATAARRRWLPAADELVEHGLAFLFARLRRPDGTYAASVAPDGTPVDGAFDLYEHAFILFALAEAARGHAHREPRLRGEAEALLRCIRATWAHPLGGFEEAQPRTLPLRSNPHMHLLEAALAWASLSHGPQREVWTILVDELVALCVSRFVDPSSGALRECFDGDWRPMPGAAGRVVEPGHQFEWSWLLMRVARERNRPALRKTALRLLKIGERHGVDRTRHVAVDVIGDDFRPIEASARLWPQTERVKAWGLAREAESITGDADERLRDAVRGLSSFVGSPLCGTWQERMREDGTFVAQHCRASSLYHIVGAIDALRGVESTGPERRG